MTSLRQHRLLLRLLDIILSAFGLIASSPLLVILYLVGLLDTGSPIFRQQRVGRLQRPFTLIKFRTMKVTTVSVASHLADRSSITALGVFLRRTKFDELPQLWNVLTGDMSLVGPRPCLFNQQQLIYERCVRSVFDVRPGITGLAQVSGIDMSTPKLLAETDALMLQDFDLWKYFKYILLTIIGKGIGDRIFKHD